MPGRMNVRKGIVMKSIYKQRVEQAKNCLAPLGEICSRTQFGGYSLSVGGAIFALVMKENLYLRANEKNERVFIKHGLPRMAYSKRGIAIRLRYYRVEQALWENETLLLELARIALEGTRQDVAERAADNQRLKDLPNIGINMERRLWVAGIEDRQQLYYYGAKECFLKLSRFNKLLSVNVLLALEGAITGFHQAALPAASRNELIAWFEENKPERSARTNK